jgi:predicted component of type VI protein secretion system
MSDANERRHHYFRVRETGVPERVLVLDTQELTIGRAKDNDLRADYPEMSRRHARIVCEAGVTTVQNLSKSNGTFVNERIVKQHTLEDGDAIRIADLELTYAAGTDNPASLGCELKYVSELKGFGAIAVGGDSEATMLGLVDELDTSGDTFEIDQVAVFDPDRGDLTPPPQVETSAEPPRKRARREPRNLDLELEGFGLEDLGEEQAAAEAEPNEPVSGLASVPDAVWELDAGAPPAAVAREPAGAPGTLSLTLEIEGLTPELRVAAESLIGKVIALPSVRIRIKDEDLG